MHDSIILNPPRNPIELKSSHKIQRKKIKPFPKYEKSVIMFLGATKRSTASQHSEQLDIRAPYTGFQVDDTTSGFSSCTFSNCDNAINDDMLHPSEVSRALYPLPPLSSGEIDVNYDMFAARHGASLSASSPSPPIVSCEETGEHQNDTAHTFKSNFAADKEDDATSGIRRNRPSAIQKIENVFRSLSFTKRNKKSNNDGRNYIDGEPTDKDVLLGRGGGTNKHPGNIRYRREVESKKPIYRSINCKNEKTAYTNAFKDYVHSYGGRFLEKEKDTGRWMIADAGKARKKCSQAFREMEKAALKRERSDKKMNRATSIKSPKRVRKGGLN